MVYVADIADYSEGFFEKAALLLPPEKYDDVLKITNSKARNESCFAWLLLRYALVENGITDFFDLKFSERGKPSFINKNIFFNLSHSGKKVCVALSFESEIGIDIQFQSRFSDKMKKRVFCEHELSSSEKFTDVDRCFTRLWAVKESYLKNIGTGIAFDLKSLDFSNGLSNDFFESDCLFYTVFEIDNYALSVCSGEKEKQLLRHVTADKLIDFVKK